MGIARFLPGPLKRKIKKILLRGGYTIDVIQPERYGIALYEQLYPAESLAGNRFYNIGAGDFRLPFWTNVDHASEWYKGGQANIDLDWDISGESPLPIDSDAAELIYTSHTIEHLQDDHNRHLFAEAHRVLKPGGGLRVTCPNIELYWQAWKRGDVHFSYHLGHYSPFGSATHPGYGKGFLSLFVLNECATQLKNPESGNCRYTNPAELDAIFQELGLEGAMEFFRKQINFDIQRRDVGSHVNYWTHGKLATFLKEAGFSEVVVSGPGQSIFPVLRDTRHFDATIPYASLFIDAVK